MSKATTTSEFSRRPRGHLANNLSIYYDFLPTNKTNRYTFYIIYSSCNTRWFSLLASAEECTIRHWQISHNTLLLGITVVPRAIEDNADTKFWGVNKVYYGRCPNGEHKGKKINQLWMDKKQALTTGIKIEVIV